MTGGPRLGIVVPTLNESETLPHLLDDLSGLAIPHRIVVVDGGSTDGTPERARDHGAEVRTARRGRASQLNAGAAVLDTPWLLFLHADVRLGEGAGAALAAWLSGAEPEDAAYFRLRLAGERSFYRLVERVQRLRERVSGLVYGDQGLVVSRTAFDVVGGYPDVPLMEDVDIVRRLRRHARLECLDAELISSPRRYEREGPLFGWCRNGVLLGLHLAGVPPRFLARWYRPEPVPRSESDPAPQSEPDPAPPLEPHPVPPSEPDPSNSEGEVPDAGRILLVFAKVPTEGRVKTRLAREIGAARATRLYRRMGRRIVDQLRGGPYRIVICYDPPDAEDRAREWLGEHDIRFLPQERGGLGRRMSHAFQWAFERAKRVCIVGTDAPDVDRLVVEEAFHALEDADVVLGPATDGGYYLMALDRPRSDLFRDVPWSTSTVLATTLDRAGRSGLRVHLLEERTDLDTRRDLERLTGR